MSSRPVASFFGWQRAGTSPNNGNQPTRTKIDVTNGRCYKGWEGRILNVVKVGTTPNVEEMEEIQPEGIPRSLK